MCAKKLMKAIVFAAVIVSMILAGGTLRSAEAFSVDIKSLSYSDQFDSVSPARTINYDFSAGTLSNNTVAIPDSFVTRKPADTGLSFIFTPYPAGDGETNDIAVVLDTTGHKSTLSTSTLGGCIISSTPNLPVIDSAAPGWTWAVQLTNFTGITDSTKEYGTQIGFGSMTTPGPHPELTANWRTGGGLEIDAVIYDNTGDGSEIWFSDEIVLTGQNPASTILDLRIIRPLPPNADQITFEYKLNGGAWTTIGTYVIPVLDRPLQFSFPARFPYVSLEEYTQESAFQVGSHHWYNNATPGDPNDTFYNVWLTVHDPGQTAYSSVSVNSPGYLGETSLIFNAAGGYWELPAVVFSDNFDNNIVDSSNWSASGSTVTESEGALKVDQAFADAGGKVLSRAFQINPYAPIVVQRKAKVHYANNYFDGVFALFFGNNTDFTTWENDTLSVVVSHANHDTASAHGFYLGSQPARFQNTFPVTSAIWDNWFEEKIIYDPVSGLAELYIDGLQKASINLGALPAGTTYLKVYIDAWGATAGHYNYSDDLSVSQKYTGSPVFLSDNNPPVSPVTFNFTATKKAGGTDTVSQQITGYVQDFATNLSLAGAITNPTPTFSWTGITGASAYAVQLRDANWNHMWNKYDITSTINSVVYNGPALESGKTYYYNILSNIETNGMNNSSFAQGSFTYTGTVPATITVSGIVKDWSGNVITSPGVTVTLVGDSTKTTVSSTTDGSFSLPGVPANTSFSLKFSRAGYLDVYTVDIGGSSSDMNINFDAYGGSSMYNMPTAGDLTAQGVLPVSGKALIAARVSDQTYKYSSNVGGVVVTATGDGGKNYPVTYRDPFGVLVNTSSTWGNGRYYILNVDGGDTVNVTASRSGWVFDPRTYHTQGNSVIQGRTWGAAPGYDLSISGFMKNFAGGPVSGAKFELNGDSNKYTFTNSDGSYNFSGLPRDASFYMKVTAGGYVPVYVGPVNLLSSISGVPNVMLTASQMTGFGVTGSNGLIVCTVRDQWMNPLSGVTVTLTSKSGTAYIPLYLEGGNGATAASGNFAVSNIIPGDVVKIEAVRSGYGFNPVYLDGFSGAITEKIVFGAAVPPLHGDLDGNQVVNLADLILALKAAAGLNPAGIRANYPASGADVNNDGKVGMAEAIYILQKLGGLRLEGMGTHTAGGTYTYVSGTLNLNWTSSDFQCEGPDLGAETKTGVTITSTTMTWLDDDEMTWNRSGGTPGDIVGTWTSSDSETGNSWMLTLNANGTVSVVGNIVYCEPQFRAMSSHWSDGYYVSLEYDDPSRTATSVSVTGPGIIGSKSLAYSANWGSWNSWTSPSSQVFFGTPYPPGLPYIYTFSITDGTGTWTASSTVSCFQVPVAANPSPTGTVSGGITFNWTGINDSNALYQVQLNDSNNNRIWDSPKVTGTSVAYTGGPALTSGTTYYYWVVVVRSSSCDEESFAQGSFTYN